MKNQEIKHRSGYFMGYLMGFWQIIIKYEDKNLSKLLRRSLYGGIHFLQVLNA